MHRNTKSRSSLIDSHSSRSKRQPRHARWQTVMHHLAFRSLLLEQRRRDFDVQKSLHLGTSEQQQSVAGQSSRTKPTRLQGNEGAQDAEWTERKASENDQIDGAQVKRKTHDLQLLLDLLRRANHRRRLVACAHTITDTRSAD